MKTLMFCALMLSAALLIAAGETAGRQPGDKSVPVDDFEGEVDADGLPQGWEPVTFDGIERHTRYSVRSDDGNRFLHAASVSAASGLAREVSVDIKEHPILTWRWRIRRTLPKGNARKKSGDDYAARIYVNFKYDPSQVGVFTRLKYSLAKKKRGEYPPLHALNYIWANRLKRGTFLENAFVGRAMMVAVRSGDDGAGEWQAESRNVYEDYKKAFEGEPPPVTHIAVMTDTDNTEGTAVADYDDIRFEAAPEGE